jgi:hypothetical protein
MTSDETELERELLQAATRTDAWSREAREVGRNALADLYASEAATLRARAAHVRELATKAQRRPAHFLFFEAPEKTIAALTGPLPAPAEVPTKCPVCLGVNGEHLWQHDLPTCAEKGSSR